MKDKPHHSGATLCPASQQTFVNPIAAAMYSKRDADPLAYRVYDLSGTMAGLHCVTETALLPCPLLYLQNSALLVVRNTALN